MADSAPSDCGSAPPGSEGMGARGLRARALVAAAALVLGTLAVYAQTGDHAFLSFDDKEYVSENPFVARGLDAEGVRWAFTTGYASNWHPLTWLSHMLDVSCFGVEAPGPHHLVNVAWHLLATLLLLAALVRMTGDLGASAMVAALFALHPLHVESVAWVSERKDVLSGAFWMLSLLAYALYVERPGALRYAAVASSFALGLLAKPVLVTLPFVLLLLDYWPLGRLRGGDGARARRLVVEKLPLLALSLASSVATYLVQREAMDDLDPVPLADRLANALVSYAAYLEQLVWPANLAPFYPHSYMPGQAPLSAGSVLAAGLVLVLVSACVAVATRRGRGEALTGWLWYLGTLVPMIGIVQVGRAAMADRYTYIPTVGIFVLAVWGGRAWLARAAAWLPAAVAALVLVGCVVVSHRQAALWKDDLTLFAHTIRVTSNNSMAHKLLGVAHANRDEDDLAREHLARAAAIHPGDFDAREVLGRLLVRNGEWEAAGPVLEEAAALRPDDPRVQYFLARVAVEQGDSSRARRHLLRVLERKPEPDVEVKARRLLAREYERTGELEAAVREYAAVLVAEPDAVQALSRLAWIHATDDRLLRPRLALELAARAVEVSGGRQPRHLTVLAAAYAADGDFATAVRLLEDVRGQLDPSAERQQRELEAQLERYRGGVAWRVPRRS